KKLQCRKNKGDIRFRILLVAVLLCCSANLLAQTCNPMAGDACPGWARATPSTGIVPLTVSFRYISRKPRRRNSALFLAILPLGFWRRSDVYRVPTYPCIHGTGPLHSDRCL